MADMVKTKSKLTEAKGKRAKKAVEAVKLLWSITYIYADDAGVVSPSPEGVENMTSIIVRGSGLFGLMVSGPETEVMCMLTKGMEQRPFKVNAAGQLYKLTDTFVYLGGTIRQDGPRQRTASDETATRCTTAAVESNFSPTCPGSKQKSYDTLLYECVMWKLKPLF